uniref:Uncharacterized protein n=1 Tax=Trichobilharzia regenti TaxID=157069 RepID=A0AA85JLY6_TRIRE|nr:unnamed protein product [Trichobilharzia regenti]
MSETSHFSNTQLVCWAFGIRTLYLKNSDIITCKQLQLESTEEETIEAIVKATKNLCHDQRIRKKLDLSPEEVVFKEKVFPVFMHLMVIDAYSTASLFSSLQMCANVIHPGPS